MFFLTVSPLTSMLCVFFLTQNMQERSSLLVHQNIVVIVMTVYI